MTSKTITVSLIVLTICSVSPPLHSQNAQGFRRTELSGSIAYAFNSDSYDFQFPGGFEPYEYTHTLAFQPGIGYLLTPNLEVNLVLNYRAMLLFWNGYNLVGSTASEEKYRSWFHSFGFVAGPSYNLHLKGETTLYGQIACGLAWSKNGSDSPSRLYDPSWTKPSVTFPVLVLGAKIHLSPDWQLVTYWQYAHTANATVDSKWTSNQIALGMGISVLL